MTNIPVKVYIVTSDHTNILFIGTSKKKVYEFLMSSEKFEIRTRPSYLTFTRWTTTEMPLEVDTPSGTLRIAKYNVNQPLAPPSLFT